MAAPQLKPRGVSHLTASRQTANVGSGLGAPPAVTWPPAVLLRATVADDCRGLLARAAIVGSPRTQHPGKQQQQAECRIHASGRRRLRPAARSTPLLPTPVPDTPYRACGSLAASPARGSTAAGWAGRPATTSSLRPPGDVAAELVMRRAEDAAAFPASSSAATRTTVASTPQRGDRGRHRSASIASQATSATASSVVRAAG